MVSNQDILNELMNYVDGLSHIRSDEVPDIDLYMDQVTTFMNERLAGTRADRDGAVITKTMINNYAKNRLLPAPVRKKYSRSHVLLLILIYYFKNVLSFTDIETILHPLCEGHFSRESDPALAEIYDRVFTLEDSARKNLRKDVEEKFAQCEDTFADAPEEDREYLRLFAFLCSLSFDVYVKEEMVNQIAGILREEGVPSAQGAHEQVPGEK